ncbi:MAG TPA: efflux RND transporter periplasmic adaptor subunit [Fluviicoccus sp.]|nr:efflux RND transporter periplasmic adaptor subunit [Fluviicoccus sp.]
MSHPAFRTPLLLAAMTALGGLGGYWLARHDAPPTPVSAAPAAAKPLYWYDPMKPDQHFDKPGPSPFMDMPLQPKYADSGDADTGGVRIDNRVQQNTGIRLATVERGRLNPPLTVPASVGFNERDVAIVQTRTAGFVERVYARAPGDVVAAGAPLADLLVPDWAGAQGEYLALRQAGDAALTAAARNRLRLLGMDDALIRQVEKTGQVQNTLTLTAPRSGVIQSLDIRQGMTVASGGPVARINGLGTVWLEAALPEAQAAAIHPGLNATAQLAAYPDTVLQGKVIAILPEVTSQTRTLRVRLEFPNPRRQLRPGLFAQVQFHTGGDTERLLLPSEALIRSGRQTRVILRDAQGHFQPVTVTTGQEADGRTEILSGLNAGDQVVASGQFLMDSEASLQGVLARLETPVSMGQPAPAAGAGIEAHGVVDSLDAGEITLAHEAIPVLGWPPMTMPFPLAKGVGTTGLKPGQKVRFTLEKRGEDTVITAIHPEDARP